MAQNEKKNKVILWLSLTILGGILFLSSQAWEWGHFIHGDKGGIKTKSENIAHIAKGKELSSVYDLLDEDLYSNDNLKFQEEWYDETCSCYGTEGVNVNKNFESEQCFNDKMIARIVDALKQNNEFNIRTSDKVYLSNKESIEYLEKNAQKLILGSNLEEMSMEPLCLGITSFLSQVSTVFMFLVELYYLSYYLLM